MEYCRHFLISEARYVCRLNFRKKLPGSPTEYETLSTLKLWKREIYCESGANIIC